MSSKFAQIGPLLELEEDDEKKSGHIDQEQWPEEKLLNPLGHVGLSLGGSCESF